MKTESVVQNIPFVGRKRSLIENARKERASGSSCPGPSRGGENFVFEEKEGTVTLNILFALSHEKNAGFFKTGKVFETFEAKLLNIESRPGRKSKNSGCDDLEIFMRCEVHSSDTDIFINSLKRVADDVRTIPEEKVPWFPRKIRDLDKCNLLITKYDPDMDQDHPGFSDPEYRKRRRFIAELAANYKQGEPLPRVEYTPEEVATWREVYRTLRTIYPDVQTVPGWAAAAGGSVATERTVSPSSGRSLPSSKRRRASSCVRWQGYSPPETSLLAWPSECSSVPSTSATPPHPCTPRSHKEFAQFSQEIGLATLGASDEDIERLSTLYWFTVEFGLCKQNGTVKAYGAGLLSSYGELIYALSNEPEYKPFNPEETAIQPYQDQTFQPVYFVSESFEDAKIKMRRYSSSIQRPFSVRYDPFTCSLEVLDQPSKIQHALGQMRDDLKILHSALEKLG